MDAYSVQPRVSIGITTYNRPQSLRHVLKCITEQNYQNLEIIISDDCSPEAETQRVVRSFMDHDPRIKYFRHQENLGPSRNNQFVLDTATGDYFMWSADDDYFDSPDLVFKLVSKMKESSYLLVFPNINFVDEVHDLIKSNVMTEVFKDCESDYDYLVAWCGYGGGYPVYGLFNLNHLRHITYRLDADLRYFNEGTFLHKFFLQGSVRFVEDVSINYVQGNSREGALITPLILLVDYLRYTKRTVLLFALCHLFLTERIKIMSIILKLHGKFSLTLLRLLGGSYYRMIRSYCGRVLKQVGIAT